MLKTITLLATLSLTTIALAHPGGVDKNGGHVDKKTGKYHRHPKPKAKTKRAMESPKKKK